MPYLIYVQDYEGMEDIRESIREQHRQHLKSIGNSLLASGALLDDNENVIGGLVLDLNSIPAKIDDIRDRELF